MDFVKQHATRIYALAIALLALITHYVPDMPNALILGVIAAGLGIGEGVQRVEHRQAAHTDRP